MINDFKKDHYYSIFEELPLIKNISFEMDSGKYILLDNKGNRYICDIYGREQPIFKKNISGFINGEQRKILKKVKSQSDIINNNNKNNLDNRTEKKTEESKFYFPSVSRFEGYTHFPKPLCPPFTNIPENVINADYKKLLINKCEQKLKVEENKKVFTKPNENLGLSYITSDIKGFMDKEKEKEKEKDNLNNSKKNYKEFLIKMIDNTVNDYKIKYKCDLMELIANHSNIRALLHLKKKLINNNETNIINGRKLKEPNINIINEYKIIYNKLINYNERNRIRNEQRRLIKCYSQLNIQKNNILNLNNVENKNKNIYGRKILKKISFNKSSNIGNKEIPFPKKEKKKITISSIDDNKKFNNIINNNNANQVLYDEQETKESLGTKPNNNLFNLRNSTNESNKEDDNLSVISLLNEKENNKFIKFNKKIKYLKILKKNSEKEKKKLEGYQKEEPKKIKEFNMNNEEEQPKYRDFAEIYKKELETLEKLNPILFNLQKKKDDNDLKKMMKKKHFKKLNEKLIMKGKELKINRPSND